MSDKKKPNYNAFIPIGITFMGTGVVFMTAVNPAIGLGIMGVGIAFIAIGIKNKKKS